MCEETDERVFCEEDRTNKDAAGTVGGVWWFAGALKTEHEKASSN